MMMLSPRRYGGAIAPAACDPLWASVLSLVHFDVDFTDQIPHTWAIDGAPFVSATESKFGGKSFRCTGNSTSDWIFDESIWTAFPALDPNFTIEFWFYLETLSGSYNRVFTTYHSNVLSASGYQYENSPFLGNADFRWTTPYGNLAPLANLSAGQWYHVALTATGGVARYFLNGVLQSSISDSNIGGNMTGYCVGASAWNGSAHIGYIDEIRVTGACRYTSDFTPSNTAFPDIAC